MPAFALSARSTAATGDFIVLVPVNWLLRLSRWLTLFLAVSVVSACGGDTEEGAQTYVGRVAATDAYIGVVANSTEMIAYVCDGNSIRRWFRGARSAGPETTLVAGDETLVMRFSASGVDGTVDAGGSPKTYTANLVPAGSPAGFYRAEVPVDDQILEGGWIVLEDGTFRGQATLGGSTTSSTQLNFSTGSALFTVSGKSSLVNVAPVSISTTTCIYSGTVTNAATQRLSGVRIKLFDVSVSPERLIGEATTDLNGNYRLVVTQPVTSLAKSYRIDVFGASGQKLGQALFAATCGSQNNISVP